MVISIIQFTVEFFNHSSLKDKRRIINSIKDKIHKKFRLSIAEIDFLDSMHRARMGAALVSNSRRHGESVLQKTLKFLEANVEGRLQDVKIFSEQF